MKDYLKTRLYLSFSVTQYFVDPKVHNYFLEIVVLAACSLVY